jgi:hypothetical protein
MGEGATPEDFYAWCREKCVEMTERWESHTLSVQQQWKEHAERLAAKLLAVTTASTTTTLTSAAPSATSPSATTISDMDMFERRELEMTRDIAVDRGNTFRSFPWWRGALTSCSVHPPGGIQYPGDHLSSALVMSAGEFLTVFGRFFFCFFLFFF